MLQRKKRLAAILLAAAVCITQVSVGAVTVSAEEGQGEIDVEKLESQNDAEGFNIGLGEMGKRELLKYTGEAKEVVIPEGVESINQYAFSGSKVTSITIPASVQRIYQYVAIPGFFNGCDSLEEVNVDSGNEVFASEDGILYSKDKTSLYYCPSKKSGILNISASVTTIYTYDLQSRNGLNEIRVDDNNQNYSSENGILYSKDKKGFYCCPGGKSGVVNIPETVTGLGAYAFTGCSGLTSITIPASVTSIAMGNYRGDSVYILFEGCTGLKELKVDSNNPSYTSENGILYDKNKTSLLCCMPGKSGAVDIPASVTSIEAGAFSDCSGLTSITIPENVNSIGNGAFSGHSEKLTIYGKAGSYAETYAKDNNIKFASVSAASHPIEKKMVSLSKRSYSYDGKAKKPVVTVKDGNTVLKEGTDYTLEYKNNKNAGTAKVIVKGKGNYKGTITKSFTITVKKGSSHTVGDCQYKVTGSSAVTITKMNNKKTTKVTIPKTVKIGGKEFKITAIGSSAFKNCKKLGTITIKSTSLKKVGKNALKGIKASAKIKVPAKKLSAYKKLLKNKGQGKKVKITK